MQRATHEFDDHADASEPRILDELPRIELRVALLKRPRAVPQLWASLGLERERLLIGDMPAAQASSQLLPLGHGVGRERTSAAR